MPESMSSASERAGDNAASGSSGDGPRDRARLWKAIAGMAAALALAGAIVSMEISSHLISRTHSYNHRIVELKETIRKLRREAETDRKHLAAVREELSAREGMVRVLLAPDVATVDFAPVSPGDKARATLRISARASGAVLTATGLEKLKTGREYEVWWMPTSGHGVRAAAFRPLADGSATVYLKEPPRRVRIPACVVTLGQSKAETPGRVILKARLPR